VSTNGSAVLDEEQVEKARAAAGDDFVELGGTGLLEYGGVLAEEFRPALQGDRAVATYKEMSEEDPTIGGSLLTIDNLVRQVPWTFEPAPDSGAEGQRWADHCQSCLDDMSLSWPETASSIFTMVPFGWSYFNVVLKRRDGEQPDRPDDPSAKPSSDYDDGLVGWRGIYERAQESKLRWEFDAVTGRLRGMWQQLLGGPARFIPIERAALFRTTARKNNPEGRSALRSAHRPWYFLRRIEEHEGIGIERDLAGLPVGGAPPEYLAANASPEQQNTARRMKAVLANIRRNTNEGLLWPTKYDDHGHELFPLKLMSSGSRRQFDLQAVIMRKRQEMAMCVRTDWLLMGHEGVGSRALVDPRIEDFHRSLETWTRGVAGVFDSHVTPRLMRANGVSAKLSPKLRPGKVTQVDMEQFAAAWSQLVTSGAITNTPETEAWARAQVGAPPNEVDGVAA
jgi:hypothetical protein